MGGFALHCAAARRGRAVRDHGVCVTRSTRARLRIAIGATIRHILTLSSRRRASGLRRCPGLIRGATDESSCRNAVSNDDHRRTRSSSFRWCCSPWSRAVASLLPSIARDANRSVPRIVRVVCPMPVRGSANDRIDSLRPSRWNPTREQRREQERLPQRTYSIWRSVRVEDNSVF